MPSSVPCCRMVPSGRIQRGWQGAASGVVSQAAAVADTVASKVSRFSRPLPLAPRIGIVAYIVVSISRAHQVYGFIGKLRPALLVFGFLVVYAFLYPGTLDQRALFRSWPTKAIVGLAFCACMSIPLGISMGASGKFFLEEYSRELILVAIFVMCIRTIAELRIYIWAYVGSCLFWAYMGIFRLGSIPTATGLARLNASYTYDANDLGLVIAIGIALSMLMMTTARGWRPKLIALATALGGAATVALTGSRGGFLGLAIILLALLLLVNQVRVIKRIAVLAAAIAVLAISAPEGYWEQMSTILHPSEDYNVKSKTGRVEILKRGLGYVALYPIFGVGINNFPRAEGTISELAANHRPGTPLRYIAPHNTFLQVAAEMGVPALLLWISIIGYGTLGLLSVRRRMPVTWRTGGGDRSFLYGACTFIPVAYIGFSVTSFFVSFAYLSPFYILTTFSAAAGFFARRELAVYRKEQRMRRDGSILRPRGPLLEQMPGQGYRPG